MKPLNVLIICAAVIAGLAIWKSGRSGSTVIISNASGQTQAVQVDVAAIQGVMKQAHDYHKALYAAENSTSPASDEDFVRTAAFIDGCVYQAQGVSTRDCPPDFAEAYRRYLGAWLEVSNVVKAHPHMEGIVESSVKNIFRGLAGDFKGPERDQVEWQEWVKQLEQAQANVESNGTEVEALAARYGAQ